MNIRWPKTKVLFPEVKEPMFPLGTTARRDRCGYDGAFVLPGITASSARRGVVGGRPPRTVVAGPMRCNALAPSKFMQSFLINSEVVGNLVNDRDSYFFDNLLLSGADFEDCTLEDGDAVRHGPCPPA